MVRVLIKLWKDQKQFEKAKAELIATANVQRENAKKLKEKNAEVDELKKIFQTKANRIENLENELMKSQVRLIQDFKFVLIIFKADLDTEKMVFEEYKNQQQAEIDRKNAKLLETQEKLKVLNLMFFTILQRLKINFRNLADNQAETAETTMSDPGLYRDPTARSSQDSTFTTISDQSLSYLAGGGLNFDSEDETKPMIPPSVSFYPCSFFAYFNKIYLNDIKNKYMFFIDTGT